jgi:hypothetical protein
MAKKKKYAQPKGHRYVFSHEEYKRQGDFVLVIRVEKCVTPRHKHSPKKTVIRKTKK